MWYASDGFYCKFDKRKILKDDQHDRHIMTCRDMSGKFSQVLNIADSRSIWDWKHGG